VATFLLIPGAGGVAWYWHRVVPLLTEAGHEAIAIDLPGDDESAGLPEYAAIVRAELARHDAVVLVGQSLGGYTVAAVSDAPNVDALVFVNAMIPAPGETAGAWWANTGSAEARTAAAIAGGYSAEFDVDTYFLHDVPPAVIAAGADKQREESDAIFAAPCGPVRRNLPITVIAGADDRFFPVEFQRRVAKERLGVDTVVIPGGHLVALSNPEALAAALLTRKVR
jgi:pimeloyl-ACP methyl ester carboxylesterase